MAYTQTTRAMRLLTPLGGDALLLAGLRGAEEVSRPFAYTLDLRSEDAAIAPESLLGKGVTVELELPWTSEPRAIHGIVRRFRQVGVGDTLATYEAEIVPWLWLLSLRRDCRVFQNQSVPQIVEAVFRAAGYGSDDYRMALIGSYPAREYCVQYRESDLDFVSRLLEDEGIYYYFEHASGRHVLHLSNNSATARPCPARGTVRVDPDEMAAGFQDSVPRFTRERAMHVPAVALADYDFLKPSARLEVELAGAAPAPESYDYPGGFADQGEGRRYAKLRLEEAEAMRDVATASGAFPGFASGYKIEVAGHAMRAVDGAYFVVAARHTASDGGFAGGDGAGGFAYACEATLTPADVPHRPPRRTPRPCVSGTQSAFVVGPRGEEIHTDAHGRVKVQFHWDRAGKHDENSSCWVRVSTAWAGKGWGQFSVPRIGQEVLVDFMEGDPDRPVVVGRVYNAEQVPPCDPGARGGVVSGMRSKTHKGGGYNAVEMDDTAGKEQIVVHAQYDMTTDVGHDDRVTIGNDRTERVGKNETITIGVDRTENVGANEHGAVAANRSWAVGAADSLTVGGSRTETVAMASAESVGLAKALSVGAAYQVSVGGAFNTTVGAMMAEEIALSRVIGVGKKFSLEAGEEIVLKTGDASITMKKNGDIVVKGNKITIKGSGDVVVKGSKIAKN